MNLNEQFLLDALDRNLVRVSERNKSVLDFIKENEKCQDCQKRSPDVRLRKCPYDEDLHNRIVMVKICDACEKLRMMEL